MCLICFYLSLLSYFSSCVAFIPPDVIPFNNSQIVTVQLKDVDVDYHFFAHVDKIFLQEMATFCRAIFQGLSFKSFCISVFNCDLQMRYVCIFGTFLESTRASLSVLKIL